MLGASFNIGRSALAAYQSAIALTGQNVANVGNPNYTRLSGRLRPLEGGPTLGGPSAGGGVMMSALDRHVDEALEARLRTANSALTGSEMKYNLLREVEALYNELTEYDLSTQLAQFFNSFADLQNDPDEMTGRNLVLAESEAVIHTLQRQRNTLVEKSVEVNRSIEEHTQRANEIAEELAKLNELVVVQESRGSGYSAPLRDRRDALLRELSGLMDIEIRERDNGSINVYVGSEPLVEFNRSRGLSTATEYVDGLAQASVRFTDSNGTVLIRDGQIGAQLQARDEYLMGQVSELDQLARGLIYEVNRVHTTGVGLVGWSSMTSTYAVDDPQAALNTSRAGLNFPVENGSFVINVRQQDSGHTVTRLIEVDLDGIGQDTTLESLAQSLNGVPNLNASVTADNRLQIDPDDGFEVWFSEDTSGAPAALGLGTLLDGTDAATISLNSAVRADARLVAASLTGETADGQNAGRLALLADQASTLLRDQSAQEFQAAMVNAVAIEASGAVNTYEAADAVYSSLMAQRESISGVSLDEEAINLTQYERAFEGAARYLTVLDTLSATVLSLVR